MLATLASLLLRSAVLFVAAAAFCRLPGRTTAADRHRIVLTVFALLLCWPIFFATVPEIHIPTGWLHSSNSQVAVTQGQFSILNGSPHPPHIDWLLVLWITGLVAALTPVLFGQFTALRIVWRATTLSASPWNELLLQLCREFEIRKPPQILLLAEPSIPLTIGILRRRIILPQSCLLWTPMRRQAVLLHELAHIRRRDTLIQFLAGVTAAFWWFQPLCWISRRTLRRESERACDDLVLSRGIKPSDYAAELLDLARCSTPPSWGTAAFSMARTSELPDRLDAILNRHSYRPRRVLALAAIPLLTVLAMTASAVTAVSKDRFNSQGGPYMNRKLFSGLLASAGLSAATIGGSLYDASGNPISNAKAVLNELGNQTKQEASTDSDGKFAFENLPAGEYLLRIDKTGFASLLREFNVQTDSAVQRGLTLKLAPEQAQGVAQVASGERTAYPQPLNSEQLRVGGEAAQANLVTKVQPVYPVAAKAQRIQGIVNLEVVISKEGVPEDLSVVSSPSDDLSQSALEAVRQWRYKPMLLNGNPVEIVTVVKVNYTLSQ